VLLVKRRAVTGDAAWSLPGGGIDPGESDEQAAKRELEEEAGATGKSYRSLGYFVATSNKSNRKTRIHAFIFNFDQLISEGCWKESLLRERMWTTLDLKSLKNIVKKKHDFEILQAVCHALGPLYSC